MCIFCSVFLWSASTKFSVIADHYGGLPSSWLTPRMRRKPLLWSRRACVQKTRYPLSGFTASQKCNTCGRMPSQLVSKYLRTLWSEDILSFRVCTNLNLRRRAVGKSESPLLPPPRASLDPFHDIFTCQLWAQVVSAWRSMNTYLCYIWLDYLLMCVHTAMPWVGSSFFRRSDARRILA